MDFYQYQLLAKGKSPFCDFCATKQAFYIINWQRGQYIRTSNLKTAADFQGPFPISQGCKKGQFVCAASEQYFYVIDPSNWNVHRTSSIKQDTDAYNYTLKPKLQNTTNVCAADKQFFYYVIQGGIECTQTANTDHYEGIVTKHLDRRCICGDYYLSTDPGNFYIIYGTHVHHRSSMFTFDTISDFALHPKLVEYMPFTDCKGQWVSVRYGVGPVFFVGTFKFGVNYTLSDSFAIKGSAPAQQPSFEMVLKIFNVPAKYHQELTQQYQSTSKTTHIFVTSYEHYQSVKEGDFLWQWVFTAKNAAGELQTLSTKWFKSHASMPDPLIS